MEASGDFLGEDAEVEEDNRDLSGDDDDLVEPLFDVEILCEVLLVYV